MLLNLYKNDFFKQKGVLLSKPEDCPEWIYDIMLNCWKKETKDRITFTQALKILVSEGDDQGIFAGNYLNGNRCFDCLPQKVIIIIIILIL